jgi:hypothetical protein
MFFCVKRVASFTQKIHEEEYFLWIFRFDKTSMI